MNVLSFPTRLFAAGAIAFAVSTSASAQIELVTNGSFENGLNDWLTFGTGPLATITTTSDATDGASAAQLTNNAPALGLVIKQERFAVGQVAEGDELTISFDAKGTAAEGGVFFAQLFYETANAGSSNGAGFLTPFSLTDSYQTFSFTQTIDSDVAGGLSIQFNAATGGASGSSAELFVDNVSILVPEPASMALLGLGSVAMLARRRRQA